LDETVHPLSDRERFLDQRVMLSVFQGISLSALSPL
jgi:hypothetical protein